MKAKIQITAILFITLFLYSCKPEEETFTFTLSGFVTDSVTKNWIQDATVTLTETNGNSYTIKTDKMGYYSFDNSIITIDKSYSIQVTKEGYYNNENSEGEITTTGLTQNKDFTYNFILNPKDSTQDTNKKVTLIFSDDIIVDLGATDADVLEFVTASDGSTVTVTGVDYEKVGEQTATFKAGDVTETKSVKIKADKLAGTYQIKILTLDNQPLRQGTFEVSTTDNYNELSLLGIADWFGATEMILTFDGNNITTPTIEAPVLYVNGSEGITGFSSKFSNITYKKINKKYSLVSMSVFNYGEGIENMYFTVTFTKM